MYIAVVFLFSCSCSRFAAALLWAQEFRATLSGAANDPSGEVEQ
jgi:hypothetical protein